MNKKPDDVLSQILIDKIEKSKLINKRFTDKLKKRFTLGNLTAEDWELFVEDIPDKERKDGKKN